MPEAVRTVRCNECNMLLPELDCVREYWDANIYVCIVCATNGRNYCGWGCGAHSTRTVMVENFSGTYILLSVCSYCSWSSFTDYQSYLDESREDDEEHEERGDSPFVTNDLVFHKADNIKDRKENRSARLVAVEIEVADAMSSEYENIRDTVSKWSGSIVEDGSLPSGGFEINTAPAAGDVFLREIREISASLRAAGAQVTNSCGLHVHIDTRDHSYSDLQKLMRVYAFLEPALIRTQPYNRVMQGSYCTPCGESYLRAMRDGSMPKDAKSYGKSVKQHLYQAAYGIRPREGGYRTRNTTERRGRGSRMLRSPSKYDGLRYNALNVHSWFYRGTVECRLHTGTVSESKIIAWATLWESIVDTAYAMSDKAVAAMLMREPYAVLMGMTPERARPIIEARYQTFSGQYNREVS